MYGVSDDDLKKKLLEKGNTLTRIQAVSIGKAHETTNQEVQECCLKPPMSDNTNAVFKDKPNKGLMSNYCTNQKGPHSFANKRHCPAWGAVCSGAPAARRAAKRSPVSNPYMRNKRKPMN